VAGRRNVSEEVLENGLEEESEQDLRPQYQEAGFIECSPELPILIHSGFPECNDLAGNGFHFKLLGVLEESRQWSRVPTIWMHETVREEDKFAPVWFLDPEKIQ
jgi:hypothetical protein